MNNLAKAKKGDTIIPRVEWVGLWNGLTFNSYMKKLIGKEIKVEEVRYDYICAGGWSFPHGSYEIVEDEIAKPNFNDLIKRIVELEKKFLGGTNTFL